MFLNPSVFIKSDRNREFSGIRDGNKGWNKDERTFKIYKILVLISVKYIIYVKYIKFSCYV